MAENIILLIGRDDASSRLAVTLPKGQLMLLGKEGSVPNSVSRFKPEQKTAHAKITINPVTLNMEIENLNPSNYTWVGQERVTDEPVKIGPKSQITLGGDYYRLNFDAILKKLGIKMIDVSALEPVWEKYDRALQELTIEQQKKSNQQRLQGLFSLGGMVLIAGTQVFDFPESVKSTVNIIRIVLVVAAVIMAVYFFMKGRNVNDSYAMKKRELDDWMKEHYRCPHCDAPIPPAVDFEQLKYRKCSNCLGKFSTNA